MIETGGKDELLAQLDGEPNCRKIRLERWFDSPTANVWAALTESDQISEWFTPAYLEPKLHGRVRLDSHQGKPMMEGIITVFDPPELLEYFWVDDHQTSIVRWELAARGTGTQLTLTEYFLADLNAVSRCAGWQMYLERFELYLRGDPYPLAKDRFHYLKELYALSLKNAGGGG